MSAKDDVERLEQKIDILYNVVFRLAEDAGIDTHNLATHLHKNIYPLVGVTELNVEEFDALGKNNFRLKD